jgi:3-oxoacyl-[acyl-carrier-protein] synthase II
LTPRPITGVGLVSSLGVGRAELVDALRTRGDAPCGSSRAETFDLGAYAGVDGVSAARVAEVPGFDATKYLGDKGLRSLDRLTKLLVVAARQALVDAGLKEDGAWVAAPSGPARGGESVGIVVSNAYGSLEAINELDRVAVLEDRRYINPSRFPLTVANSAAGYASIWEDLRALNVSVSDGNCGALDAVALADAMLEQARAQALLVGGAEAMSEALFLAFHRLGTDAAVIGEAAALVVLETSASAATRGALPLAEITGYGTAFVAPERDASLVGPSQAALERAIVGALADAGATPSSIDVVVSGASGLRAFDDLELGAIGTVLGPDVAVVAPKLALGETLGAGGALGMIAALAHLRDGVPSPQVRGRVRSEVHSAVVTSMGYYGNASALVMRRASR